MGTEMSLNKAVITLPLLACIFCILPTFGSFVPQELPGFTSEKCQEEALDISEVLTSVAEMLSSNNPTPSSYPLSCLEVKERSPSSPSGYYTLSDGTGNTNIVYCNMDELYSCPSLEQALKGIQLSLDQNTHSVTSQLDNIQHDTNTLGNTLNNVLESQEVANTLNAAINNTVNSVLDGQKYTDTLIEATNNDVHDVLDRQAYFTTVSTAVIDTVNDVLNLTQELINLHLPASCQEGINETTNLTLETIFEDLCNTPGPWTRVAFLNMSDPTQNCSSPFAVYESNGVRACGRPQPLIYGCQSVTFPVNQTSYSQVCGRVIGYQYYSIDGFITRTIDEVYVDGISLTHGSPRQHIWSFAATKDTSGPNSCPCAGGDSPPTFVGNDYFCESGSNGDPVNSIMYTSDPLWDGEGCVGGEPVTCCQVTDIPWFHKVLNTSTTDFIELRMCGFSDEDSPLSLYEIYIM